MTRTEYPWLLPSALAAHELPGRPGRPRRTVRDWVVDITALPLRRRASGWLALAAIEADPHHPGGRLVADSLLGAAACCALWVRRRWPVAVAAALTVLSLVEPVAAGAMLIALFSLAVHRPFRPVASSARSPWPPPPHSRCCALTRPLLLASTIIGVLLVLLVLSWGMVVRSRRQLVVTLRERARRAEAEAALRAEQAQRLAREAIAREMHDVLAHRLTLLSVHAGALEFRPDAPPAEVARAAGVIRDSAHEALQDLREIIGVLRGPGDSDEGNRPQPTLVTLDALIDESRSAGMEVTLSHRVADPAGAPAATGRTVYRIAQEALTNARKHAPGAPVDVTVAGGPGDGLTIEVGNPAPAEPFEPVPGSGQGLIGLTERAGLAGGSLDHGPRPDGGFTVKARLPWPA